MEALTSTLSPSKTYGTTNRLCFLYKGAIYPNQAKVMRSSVALSHPNMRIEYVRATGMVVSLMALSIPQTRSSLTNRTASESTTGWLGSAATPCSR